ncbi:MAG: UDP-N-acetylglucosamine 2-epimerase (non-hydrolyzing) [Bdellovibrionota bacterium]
MKSLAIVLGTRPEIIKLAPVILALRESKICQPIVIFSGQHQSMAEQAFAAFDLKPDVNLALMQVNQTPNSFLGALLPALENVLSGNRPNGIIVQGDTTTALGGAICGFHLKLPIFHVEAGLRTGNLHSPFPEEMNRVLISRLADLHFCHTERARQNLEGEGIRTGLHVVGNTVVDALMLIAQRLATGKLTVQPEVANLRLKSNRVLLVTGHRRENFEGPLKNLCRVLSRLAEEIPELEIIYPVHLNPNVHDTVHAELGKTERIHLIPPVNYPSFIALMTIASLIVTDSGGVQEEAPSLGKRVLVTRSTTERPEAIDVGCSEVFPLDEPDALFARAKELLQNSSQRQVPMSNPYGSGTAGIRIRELLEAKLK